MMAYDFSPCFSIFFLPHLRPTTGAAATSTTVSSTLPPHGVLLRPLSLCDSSLLLSPRRASFKFKGNRQCYADTWLGGGKGREYTFNVFNVGVGTLWCCLRRLATYFILSFHSLFRLLSLVYIVELMKILFGTFFLQRTILVQLIQVENEVDFWGNLSTYR